MYKSWEGLALVAILIVVELVFSFDNAAVNAKYLERLNPFWQKMFLTVGILIAVFGMRLIFPFVVVCLGGGITPTEAVKLANAGGEAHTPGTYGYILHEAHPGIAAFGGLFLLMLFLDFLFDDERELTWLRSLERGAQKFAVVGSMSALVSIVVLLLTAQFLATEDKFGTVLFAGILGIGTYLLVGGISSAMEAREAEMDENFQRGGAVQLAGKAAFSLFMFLEVLDASFSFDGVIGAFAISTDPIIIALGLGVGALFVRSMTIYLVRTGAMAEYRYLEHGAHWAIGALAILLMVTIRYDIPELVIGLTGIAFIAAAFRASVKANKQDELAGSSS